MARRRRDGGEDREGGKGNGEGRDGGERGDPGPGPGHDSPDSGALEWLKSIAMALVLFLILRTFVVQTFVITSGSMEDTLLVGDFLVVTRAAIGSPVPFTGLRIPGYSEPRRFDVLVFDAPHTDDTLVKRLIGLPGDTLQMDGGVLFINGERREEPYVKDDGLPDGPHPAMVWQADHLLPGVDPVTYAPTRETWGPLVVPADRYFMLGDHRDASYDSRHWGLLEGWRLEGRVSFIYYSYDRDSRRPFSWLREVRWGRIGDGIG